MVARELARAGYRVEVYEEDEAIGRPAHCTGIISYTTARIIGRPALSNIDIKYENILIINNSSGNQLRITPTSPVVHVNRPRLEEDLAREAIREGAEIMLGERISLVKPLQGTIEIASEKGVRRAYSSVIIAAGLRGRNLIGGWNCYTRNYYGLNVECNCSAGTSLKVIVFPDIAGSYYSWIAPLGPNRMIAGAEAPRSNAVIASIERLLALSLAGNNKIIARYGGLVLHGPPCRPPSRASRGIIPVGDTAGFNKPLTGGGLWPTAFYVRELSNNLARGVTLNRALLLAYNAVWRRLHKQYLLFNRLLNSKSLSVIIDAAASAGIDRILEGRIDYDMHDSMLKTLLATPRGLIAGVRVLVKTPRLALAILGGLVRPSW